jgi:hypothetical protein
MLLPGLLESPEDKTVEGGKGIVDSHPGIAIESVPPVEHDIECGHDDAHQPQPDTGTILKPDIYQPEYRCEYV